MIRLSGWPGHSMKICQLVLQPVNLTSSYLQIAIPDCEEFHPFENNQRNCHFQLALKERQPSVTFPDSTDNLKKSYICGSHDTGIHMLCSVGFGHFNTCSTGSSFAKKEFFNFQCLYFVMILQMEYLIVAFYF